MLSIMNEIDLYLLFLLCILYKIQNQIYQHLSTEVYISYQWKYRPQLIELTNFKLKLLIRFSMNKTC